MTTPGPPQGQPATGSRHLICLEAHACQHGRSLGGDLETPSPTWPHLGPVPQPRAPVLHPGDNRYSDHPQGVRLIGDITGQSSSPALPHSGRALWLFGAAASQAWPRKANAAGNAAPCDPRTKGPASGLGPKELETCSCTGVCSLLLFLLGYVGHSPTKDRAPAYTFRGTKRPAAESCGPGPCYFVQPAITRNGKYVVPGSNLQGRTMTHTTVTPGPSDYRTEAANRQIFHLPPIQSMAFRRELLQTGLRPGPGTYTLPRLMGPNTAYTSASPCYSARTRCQRGSYDEDLAKTPGPAALPKVAVDAYKTRAPAYTMAAQLKPGEGKAAKPGPADYSIGRVTLIKPQAPACTFGIHHSLYTTPLIVE
ncbi:ciliary microtubule associated protein 1A-like [Excalfactoria chinensis]|uniref:ciliary microtubule associated protein 1A-like n=1 Tax=Excalfactoria chinensis TaxID=46218 RepID=UPI003B3AF28D